MMKKPRLFLILLSVIATTFSSLAADVGEKLIITRQTDSLGFLAPIPVSISGFSAEVQAVLKFDLLFMGIVSVAPTEAKYLISGNNSSRVEGRVVERITKQEILAKAYTGSTQRAQTHAFADDIAKRLTDLPGIAQTKILFKVETGGWNSEVYLSDFDGFNARAITQDKSTVAAPCWAGQGSILYTSYKLGRPYIFSHQLGTGTRAAVAQYPGLNTSAAVSPNGTRVAMILSKNGSPDLYVSDIRGGGLKQLTATREAESSPCWSPDNQTICYVSREGGTPRLYTISATGGRARPLPTPGAPNPTEPDWSPDGKWIVFTSQMREFQLYMISPQHGKLHPLCPGEDPTWAPNSRAVIFCSGPDHRKTLSLLDAPTGSVKTIARISGSNSQPCWGK